MTTQEDTNNMAYRRTEMHHRPEEHRCNPVSPYGEANCHGEFLVDLYRKKGINITLFRPRLIPGQDRLGILEMWLKLIDKNLPVPVIVNGKNKNFPNENIIFSSSYPSTIVV